jgi:deazaflavin-dependent oxidoreductase (nitroreductase family)
LAAFRVGPKEYAMPMNRALMNAISNIHTFWYRLSGGVLGGTLAGRKMLLLTTTGRKSGRPRTVALQYLEDGDTPVVIASNGGHTTHPAWWLNLAANPEAEVQIRSEVRKVAAEKAEGEERDRLWQAAVDMYHGYEDYQKTANREIPVVVLRRKE